jgi:hypothetical protein
MLTSSCSLRNCLFILVVRLLSATSPAQDATAAPNPSPQQNTKQTCSLAGKVVNAIGGTPVRKANIRIMPEGMTGESNGPQAATTDVAGHFSFPGLAPGRYHLFVSHPSFVSYPEPEHMGIQATYTLAPGQETNDLVVRLTPGAVLRGRVTDEDGDPVARAQIQVLHARKSPRLGTGPMSEVSGGGSTDDLGEFRVFSLEPGHYYVKVIPTEMENLGQRPASTPQTTYVPTFYPAATNRENATALDLRGGDEVAVNVALQRASVYPVTGMLTNAKGSKVGMGVVMATRGMGTLGNAPVKDGKFELRLPAGRYGLIAIGMDEALAGGGGGGGGGRAVGFAGGQGPPRAFKRVDVPEGGLHDISLSLKPENAAGVQITGRVRADTGTMPADQKLLVSLQPMNSQESDSEDDDDFFFGAHNGPNGFAQTKPDGSFEMNNVGAGTYEVLINSMGPGLEDWYTKAVLIDRHDVLNSGVAVSDAPLQLDIITSPKGGAVEGVVKDHDQHPAPNAVVAVVPDSSRTKRQSAYESTSTDQNGHFIMRGLEPGEYTVYAWDNIENGAWLNADALKPYKNDGVAVTVHESGKEHVETKLIVSQQAQADQ